MLALAQYNKAVAITTSDTVDLVAQSTSDRLSSAIYVGGAGVVAAVFQDSSVVNFTAVAGQILPLQVKRINATNTTANLLVALYKI